MLQQIFVVLTVFTIIHLLRSEDAKGQNVDLSLNNSKTEVIMSARSLINLDISNLIITAKEQALEHSLVTGILQAFDDICAVITNMVPLPAPRIEQLNLQFMTRCRNYTIPLAQPLQLVKIPEFDANKDLVILATGWQNTIETSGALDQLWRAFSCRNDVNFVALDTAKYMDTMYTWSAFNADAIGEYIAQALALLWAVRPKMVRQVHLIGHSLGAQIVGEAARQYHKMQGHKLKRITALDPAKPCFLSSVPNSLHTVQSGDAKHVIIIHTNAGILGQIIPLGDFDFYAGGLSPFQPGCWDVGCSHSRAVAYFAESVYPSNENSFPAHRCATWNALEQQNCSFIQANSMGYIVSDLSVEGRGIYFVPVNSRSPYGLHSKPTFNFQSVCLAKNGECTSNGMEGQGGWLASAIGWLGFG